MGGTDTTNVKLIWALALLLNNPEALKRAQQELDQHVGRERLVKESDIKNLVFLQAVLKETMRLYPAGPLAIPHEAVQDCTVAGYDIEAGTRLLVNIPKLHRDPKVWSEPCEFRQDIRRQNILQPTKTWMLEDKILKVEEESDLEYRCATSSAPHTCFSSSWV